MLKIKKEAIREMIEYKNIPTSVEIFVGSVTKMDDDLYLVDKPCGPFVHKSGGAIAVVDLGKDMKTGLIIKDQFFDKVPKFVQRFIVYHEMGHFKNGDVSAGNKKNLKIKNALRSFGISNDMEFNADAFAANHLGKRTCVNALIWLMRETDLGFVSKIDMKQRISKLMKS